jgi:CelD/BcsL family acetyltransferase involved in cellulose biosynthesis
MHELGVAGNVFVLTVRDGDDLIGVAPFMRKGDELRIAGDSEICDYSDIISATDQRRAVLCALFAHVDEEDWRRIVIWGVRADSPTLDLLPSLAAERGLTLTIEPEAVCPRVALPESWDAYLLSLGKKDRHELRRKIRRLSEAGQIREYTLTEPAQIADALPDFLHLHRVSREDKAAFMTPDMERFFRSICSALAAEQSILLYFLELDGRRVAAILAFDCGDEVWLYNSGFDPTYSSVSVGLVSKALMLKQAIADGKRCYDFLRGAEPYKYDLGAHDLAVFRCTLTRPSRVGSPDPGP